MSRATVAIDLFDAIFDYVESVGYSEKSLLKEPRIPTRESCIVNKRVPFSIYEYVFQAAANMLNDPLMGIKMGLAPYPKSWGVIYFLVISANSISEILTVLKKYFPLVMDFIELEIDDSDEDFCRVELHFKHDRMPNPLVIDHLMANWYAAADAVFHNIAWVPRKIGFTRSGGGKEEDIRKLFKKAEVCFEQDYNFVEIPMEYMDYHSVSFNTEIFQLVQKHAEGLLYQLNSNDRVTQEIAQEIISQLPNGVPKIEVVADKLNCSGRTLQRRLSERNITFQQLVDNVRKELALELLHQSSESISNVAEKTGFHDDSTFHKAFKRWTGLSPGQFRR